MKKIIYTLLLGATLLGCSKDNNLSEESSVVGQTENTQVEALNPQNPLDQYLEQKIAKPYNIEIVYRFQEKERYWGYVFTPTEYNKAIEFANVFNYLFLEPYTRMTSQEFMREHSFVRVVIFGEYAYEVGGVYTLGWAQAGVKILIMNVNHLDSTNIYNLSARVLQTLYHEVAHTWHQAKFYPMAFNRISAADYKNDNWMTLTNTDALKSGFIQPYCASTADEDFVETIARYIVYYNAERDCGCSTTDESRWGKNQADTQYQNIPDGFDYEQYTAWKAKFPNYGRLTDSSGSPYYSTFVWEEQLKMADEKIRPTETYTGKEKIEQKMVIIKKYLQDEWNIDLDALRDEIRSRYKYVAGRDFEGNEVPRIDLTTLNNN